MKIAVTTNFQFSFFSAGSPQTALSIGESFKGSGNEVFLLNTGDADKVWWEDVKGVAGSWNIVQHGALEGDWDLCIEVGNHLLTVEERGKFKKSVWFCRKPLLYHDIEACLFPFERADRNLDGVAEVWMTAEYTTADDIQYAEILLKKPVRTLPFTWTPSAIESYRQEARAPIWNQVAVMDDVRGKPWSIHICETNTTSASSCAIPLLIMREVRQKTGLPLAPLVKIHNAEAVKETQFFRYNLLSHAFSDVPDMSGVFIGRQRVIDFVYDPMSIVVAHSRFLNVRPYLLDLLWAGIPVVHNSTVLRKLGGAAEAGYYADNEISEGRDAFVKLAGTVLTNVADFNTVVEMRKRILEEFTPMSRKIVDAWSSAAAAAVAAASAASATEAPAEAPAPEAKTPPFTVAFCDMWDGFNPEYNMFTLMLSAALPGCEVVGVALAAQTQGTKEPSILIFGPFGDAWKSVPQSIPKIHYTGENTAGIYRDDIKLNLGFQHAQMNPGTYLRLPLWMLEINWFRADADRIGNPKPFPIDRCCKVYDNMAERKKFCAFIVTNPRQPMRNAAFQWLSQYKQVDSAGRLFNNMGDQIFAGLGGGGGELKKLQFLQDYKFCLAYENDSAPGYTTEKLLHAKASGCIPIYWGDPKVERDFDTSGFIDARGVTTAGELVRLVQQVDEDDELWQRKFSVPALDEVRRDSVRRTLSECARRIFLAGGLTETEVEAIPRMIGFTEDAPAASAQPLASPTVFMTGCNDKFLPSLKIWLGTLAQHEQQEQVVYLMNDVTPASQQELSIQFPLTQFKRFPTEAPSSFPELWAPQHFAWKIWLLKEAASNPDFAGKTIFYMDSGVAMVRWPHSWLNLVKEYGMCCLVDPREYNKYRCHETFVKEMALTPEELAASQIWAGAMAFVAGAPLAVNMLNAAWEWAQKPSVIVGVKWTGQVVDGYYVGHRHDQSILSVLCKRMRVPVFPLDDVYGDISLRHTFLTGRALYAHRGLFKTHQPVAEGIDEPWVINLDRRADRLERFKKNHPDLTNRLMRLPAFEGTALSLTPRLARLFAPHDFNWKKPVMGCALSHLALWMQLINEKPEINTYLILEDDARLSPSWRTAWEKAVDENAIPGDWDVVYLGGILPPNRDAFEGLGVEKVNEHVARVRENNIFGQMPANRYFHFCAYAYVLTRRGAEKIVDTLKARGGYWTSADHMMCNIQNILNIYFLHPLVAGCYQDDDPVYQKSAFNDFSRVDKFDSDLWNNTERFSDEEVRGVMRVSAEIDILGALEDARASSAPASCAPAVQAEAVQAEAVAAQMLPRLCKRRIVSIGRDVDSSKWHEFEWLKTLFGKDISINVDTVDGPCMDEPIVLVQRPYTEEISQALVNWAAVGAKFYVLHLSDEYGKDPVDFYELPACLGVVRNYVRPDVMESEKVVVIPLGYHWSVVNGNPIQHTPRPPFRELTWSFVGTRWAGRETKLAPLTQIPSEKKCVFMDDWNSPNMLGREESLAVLLNSWMVPCPGGQNPETFRVYEALEAGAVPILVKESGTEAYLQYLNRWLPLLVAENWDHAAGLVHTLRSKVEVYEQYRMNILVAWDKMKEDLRAKIKVAYAV